MGLRQSLTFTSQTKMCFLYTHETQHQMCKLPKSNIYRLNSQQIPPKNYSKIVPYWIVVAVSNGKSESGWSKVAKSGGKRANASNSVWKILRMDWTGNFLIHTKREKGDNAFHFRIIWREKKSMLDIWHLITEAVRINESVVYLGYDFTRNIRYSMFVWTRSMQRSHNTLHQEANHKPF